MPFYAQLNNQGICIGVSMLRDEENDPMLVPVDDLDSRLLGKKYREGKFYGLNIEMPLEIRLTDTVPVIITWRDLDGNLVDDPTAIIISCQGVTETLVAEEGKAETTFAADEPGTYRVEAISADGCFTSTEVTVSGN